MSIEVEVPLVMPRPKSTPQSEFPYSVGGRCINRDWFDLPLDKVGEIMSNHLFFLRHGFDVRIHAFVLMANHFHLLVSTPRANLSQAMCYFMRNTSLDITKAGKRINQTYGSRHFRCIIDNDHYFTHCYKYIYRNPIRAGVVQQVEDYRFSTLHGLLGKSPLIIPLEEDRLLFGNINETMLWLNTPPDQKNEVAVKNAMRLGRFKLCENTANRKPHLLETEKF